MDEMTWTDPQLKARYEENSRKLEHLKETLPNLYSENDIAAYPSDKAIQLAGDGLTEADIAEKREMGGWDPRTDPLMRTNEQGDWTGVTQQQADQLVWDNRDEILARASYDGELSTWTLHQLDQLKEPQPAQSLDRDRLEPDREAPAREQHTPKRHGLGL